MLAIESNGALLHVAERGPRDGKAVIFANSLGTDLRLWDRVVARLDPSLRLVRYDKRGHGLSQVTQGPYSIWQHADDAAGLITAMGLRDPVFVGLSIGGLIGIAVAARHPQLLSGLVVSNSAARVGTAALWETRIAAIRQGGLEAISNATMERWFAPPFRATPERWLWQKMLERQPVEGYIASCYALAAADLRGAATRLALPVLTIAGSQDGATPPDVVEETAALIPGATGIRIEGAGHLPCVEAPDRYAEIITHFLKELGHV